MTKRKRPSRIVRRVLKAVDPWTASGPGWSNAGVTAIFEVTRKDGTTEMSEETIYSKDSLVVADWLRVALEADSKLKSLFRGREIT